MFHSSLMSVSTYAIQRPVDETTTGCPPAKVRTASMSSAVKTRAACANAPTDTSAITVASDAMRRCMKSSAGSRRFVEKVRFDASCTLNRMRAAALVSYLIVSCAACRAAPSPAASQAHWGRPVTLITLATLRADGLGSYGSTRGLTPPPDAFAGEAPRFTAAVSQVPLTLPSHATILPGLHPARHGIRTNDGFRL